jgi:DNA-binding MltR family transcriptional regulator
MKMAREPAGHWDEVFMREFEKESDRACVILSVAMLERALETLLKAQLAATSSSKDELLEGAYAPISSFNARIDLAHRLGLISARFCRDLHIIRRIRNDFAHDVRRCTFKDASVRARVLELSRSSGLIDKEPETRKRFQRGYRGDFQMIVSWMLYYLWYLSSRVSAMEAASPEPHYWTRDELDAALRELYGDSASSR